MSQTITVHGTSLRVRIATEAGCFRAYSPDWPGYDGTGSTPESAVRRLAGTLELAADRAVYRERTADVRRYG